MAMANCEVCKVKVSRSQKKCDDCKQNKENRSTEGTETETAGKDQSNCAIMEYLKSMGPVGTKDRMT